MLLTALLMAASPSVGVQYTPLYTRFVGDLSDSAGLGHGFQIQTLFVDAPQAPIRAYLSIDVAWTSATHTGDRFAYPAGADLQMLSFLFRGNLCWLASDALSACLGLGQGTVNINAERDRRDWGTWTYQASVDYALSPHWGVVALGQYIGEVEQEIDGIAASFTVLTAGGGVRWRW
jgi:hypothetical protein